jgi:hypothetical protein
MNELTLILAYSACSLVYLVGFYWLQSKVEKLTIENTLLKEMMKEMK